MNSLVRAIQAIDIALPQEKSIERVTRMRAVVGSLQCLLRVGVDDNLIDTQSLSCVRDIISTAAADPTLSSVDFYDVGNILGQSERRANHSVMSPDSAGNISL